MEMDVGNMMTGRNFGYRNPTDEMLKIGGNNVQRYSCDELVEIFLQMEKENKIKAPKMEFNPILHQEESDGKFHMYYPELVKFQDFTLPERVNPYQNKPYSKWNEQGQYEGKQTYWSSKSSDALQGNKYYSRRFFYKIFDPRNNYLASKMLGPKYINQIMREVRDLGFNHENATIFSIQKMNENQEDDIDLVLPMLLSDLIKKMKSEQNAGEFEKSKNKEMKENQNEKILTQEDILRELEEEQQREEEKEKQKEKENLEQSWGMQGTQQEFSVLQQDSLNNKPYRGLHENFEESDWPEQLTPSTPSFVSNPVGNTMMNLGNSIWTGGSSNNNKQEVSRSSFFPQSSFQENSAFGQQFNLNGNDSLKTLQGFGGWNSSQINIPTIPQPVSPMKIQPILQMQQPQEFQQKEETINTGEFEQNFMYNNQQEQEVEQEFNPLLSGPLEENNEEEEEPDLMFPTSSIIEQERIKFQRQMEMGMEENETFVEKDLQPQQQQPKYSSFFDTDEKEEEEIEEVPLESTKKSKNQKKTERGHGKVFSFGNIVEMHSDSKPKDTKREENPLLQPNPTKSVKHERIEINEKEQKKLHKEQKGFQKDFFYSKKEGNPEKEGAYKSSNDPYYNEGAEYVDQNQNEYYGEEEGGYYGEDGEYYGNEENGEYYPNEEGYYQGDGEGYGYEGEEGRYYPEYDENGEYDPNYQEPISEQKKTKKPVGTVVYSQKTKSIIYEHNEKNKPIVQTFEIKKGAKKKENKKKQKSTEPVVVIKKSGKIWNIPKTNSNNPIKISKKGKKKKKKKIISFNQILVSQKKASQKRETKIEKVNPIISRSSANPWGNKKVAVPKILSKKNKGMAGFPNLVKTKKSAPKGISFLQALNAKKKKQQESTQGSSYDYIQEMQKMKKKINQNDSSKKKSNLGLSEDFKNWYISKVAEMNKLKGKKGNRVMDGRDLSLMFLLVSLGGDQEVRDYIFQYFGRSSYTKRFATEFLNHKSREFSNKK